MKYIDIQEHLKKLKIFSVEDLKLLDIYYDKSKIHKRIKAGYIQKVIRGYFILANKKLNQDSLFEIANTIYHPSYISLEMAFSYYGIIPEQTFTITSVSTSKTKQFDTKIGYFDYKKIKPALYRGYTIIQNEKHKFLIAEIEKALIDYFYLNNRIKTIEDIQSLRFNINLLQKKLNIKKLRQYTQNIGSPTLSKKINLLIEYIQHD